MRDVSLLDFVRIGVEAGAPRKQVTYRRFPRASLAIEEIFQMYYTGRCGVAKIPKRATT